MHQRSHIFILGFGWSNRSRVGRLLYFGVCALNQYGRYDSFYFCVAITTMLFFSIGAQINGRSMSWLIQQRRVCKKKESRRKLRAMASLRIEFGNNFVEPWTPLVVQEFCINETVSFQLLDT